MGAHPPPRRVRGGRALPVGDLDDTLGFCRIALDSPVLALDRPFDYAIPDRMRGRVVVGSVVRVRMHGRRMRGYVTELLDTPAVPSPTALSELVSDQPLFGPREIELARWTASRYVAPLGLVLHHATPGRFSAPAVEATDGSAELEAPAPGWLPAPGAIADVLGERGVGVVVLPDPRATDELVRHVVSVAAPRRALVIAPRVAEAERLAAALPGAAVLHGEQKPKARAGAWARTRDGQASVLVGGRAALFTPVPDLGVVVVASAHDPSLKEERTPRFHALAVARRRAELADAAFIATSATPPLDLGDQPWIWPRAHAPVRPEVVRPRGGPLTPRLVDAVREATGAGRDAIVFSGRRGYVLRLRCEDCGWYPRCEGCTAGLTLFGSDSRELRCRSCGTLAALPTRCGDCGGRDLSGRGWGDERVQAELSHADLGAPVIRVDADEPMPPDRPRPAVIVGTRAVIGTVRDPVGAVVVADLDQLLGLPDFRAGERAAQLLWELTGLVEPGGRFVVQTRERDHPVVQAFTRRSYAWFAERELASRKDAGYPPFRDVVSIDIPRAASDDLQRIAREAQADLLGPLPRRDGRLGALLRTDDIGRLTAGLRELAQAHASARIDVDPVDVL